MRYLLLVLLLVASPVWATGWHKLPMIKTPIMAPPAVTTPVTSPASPQQASTANGTGVMGWYVMGFVLVFYYLAICQLEEERDPEMFKTLMCPPTPDWEFIEPFTAIP